MPLEAAVIKPIEEGLVQGANLADAAIKKAWSVLDAASEKARPSETLSPQGIAAIQGDSNG